MSTEYENIEKALQNIVPDITISYLNELDVHFQHVSEYTHQFIMNLAPEEIMPQLPIPYYIEIHNFEWEVTDFDTKINNERIEVTVYCKLEYSFSRRHKTQQQEEQYYFHDIQNINFEAVYSFYIYPDRSFSDNTIISYKRSGE